MTKRDDDIVIPTDPPWPMSEPMPEMVREVVQSEVEVLREHVAALFLRTRPTPIALTAALFVLADASSWALAHAEDKQDRLAPPSPALNLETAFQQRFQRQLVHQRRRHRRGWTG